MQSFMLDRLVTDSRKVVDQKLGVSAEKPCEIQHFHSNPCRHSLEHLGSPSKLYRSMQNFMLDRLMTDSRGLWPKNRGFQGKNRQKYLFSRKSFQTLLSVCARVLYLVCRRWGLSSSG